MAYLSNKILRNFDVLINAWRKQDILKWVLNGRVHLIWTGGEPTMKKHQESIVDCINYLENDCTGEGFDNIDYFNPNITESKK